MGLFVCVVMLNNPFSDFDSEESIDLNHKSVFRFSQKNEPQVIVPVNHFSLGLRMDLYDPIQFSLAQPIALLSQARYVKQYPIWPEN